MEADAIILGSGQAGVPLAIKLAAAGRRVLLVEREGPGGTCVNTGCTPTKTMIASARAAHVARTSGRLGIRVGDVRVDLDAVVRRKDDIVQKFRESVLRGIGQAKGLVFVRGHGRFVGERTVEVNGERHLAPTVVMDLRSPPAHLVVLGGGYVGCEFAQMFRRFGSDVTVIDGAEHLMSHEDPDVSAELEKVFQGEGIRVELRTKVAGVSKADAAVAVRTEGGEELRGSHLLVATGRRPNTDDLGCDAAGIGLDARGFVTIDDQYRTTAPGVYAVGDVTGEPQFTHVAWDDHRILLNVLMGRGRRSRAGRAYPYTAFTDPQIAGVGINERHAREHGIAYEIATMPFGRIARAIEVDEQTGILKVLVDPKTERLLGAVIVGAEAGELIHAFVTLMQAQASVRAVVDAEFVHPTFAEGLQTVVRSLARFSDD